MMLFGSVCSGIEAASVAWHPLGWQAAFLSEIEKFPSAVLAHHYPDVPNLGDMTNFKEWPHANIDVLVGGTPCQSFSVAGLRKGLDDPRGNLMLTYLGIVDRYRPKWVVWENVPGVLSSNGGRDFGTFLGALGELGYGFAYRVLDAQYFGVAQRRHRVFVVGHLGDWQPAAAVLFEQHSLQGHPAPSREKRQAVADLTANGVGTCGADDNQGQAGHLVPDSNGLDDGRVARALTATATATATGRLDPNEQTFITGTLCNNGKAAGSATQQDAESGMLVAHTLRGEGFDDSEDGTGRGTPLVPVAFAENSRNEVRLEGGDGSRTGALSTGDGKHGQGVPCVAIQEVGKRTGTSTDDKRCGVGISGEGDPMFTLQAGAQHGVAYAFQERGRSNGRELEIGGEVAYALTAPSGGGRAQERNILTPNMAVRRLTPIECERLQGFPDNYTRIAWRNKSPEDCPDGPRYKALGNSMAVPVMRWIGERIMAVDTIIKEYV